MSLRRILVIGAMFYLVGCSGVPVKPRADAFVAGTYAEPLASCMAYFRQLDGLVVGAGVGDAGARAIDGFPYLRVNRFLSRYRNIDLTGPAFEAWVDRLQALADEGRGLELRNLPASARQGLIAALPHLPGMERGAGAAGKYCGRLLRARVLSSEQGRERLRERAVVAPDYSTGKRVAGLYALTLLPVSYGIHRWQRDTDELFREASRSLTVQGELIHFIPPARERLDASTGVAEVLRRSSANPLGIPEPNKKEQALLFNTFAPIWAVDVVSVDDRIGTLHWPDSGEAPLVDTRRPLVYRHLSHAYFDGRVLLQLNYIFWFPSRPCTSGLDMLCGQLDGITWRITLSPEGKPLLYESMHNCGCFHLFFPTNGVRLKPPPPVLDESAHVPARIPDLGPGDHLVVRIASRTHHIERVYTVAEPGDVGAAYAWADYRSLRSLPLPQGGWRSLFRPVDGVISGTERKERWFLWPMGIASPGAMRQWGRHATAFVGERHFDDPCLMQEAFFPVAGEASVSPDKQRPRYRLCNREP